MARPTNPFGKTREAGNPYAIYRSRDGRWEWRVLKTYQRPDMAAKNQHARWFLAVRSPHTFGSFERGDDYPNRNDFSPGVRNIGILTSCTRAWAEHYGQDAGDAGVHITDEDVA